MGDTFDHELDAFESQMHDSMYGDGDIGGQYTGYSHNPLYHHVKRKMKIVHETEKAYLVFLKLEKVHTWIPKSLCKKVKDKSMYIWNKYQIKEVDYDPDKYKKSQASGTPEFPDFSGFSEFYDSSDNSDNNTPDSIYNDMDISETKILD